MKTIDEIREDVERRLKEPDGKRKIDARRNVVRKLGRKLAEVRARGGTPRIRGRARARFTINEGSARRGGLNLEVCGHRVAVLDLRAKDGPRLRLLPPAGLAEPWQDETSLAWSKLAKDGEKIRDFIKACAEACGERQPERQIQQQLFDALKAGHRSDPARAWLAQLRNCRPVTPFGVLMELSTVVGSRGAPATGNMDFLVRTGTGRGGGEYAVFELKEPKFRDARAALEQAIRYAAALAIEMRGFEDDYRRFFANRNGTPNGARYKGKRLAVGAVAVLSVDAEKNATNALNNLRARSRAKERAGMKVGVLLYDHRKLQLTDLRWHESGWSPNRTPRS